MTLSISLGACRAPSPPHTGFLTTYDNLIEVTPSSSQYVDPGDVFSEYVALIIDPVEIKADLTRRKITQPAAVHLTQFTTDSFINALHDRLPIVDEPAPHVARLRIALTDIRRATWWLNLHPGMKLTGAGLGGAAVELELVDSLTNQQLLALVESRFGNRIEIDMFSPYDDARDAITSWTTLVRKHVVRAQAGLSASSTGAITPQSHPAREQVAHPATQSEPSDERCP